MNIFTAAIEGNIRFIREAANNTNFNQTNSSGYTAAQLAARHGHADIIEELANRGADLSYRHAETGETVAELAVRHAHYNVLDTLTDLEVDLNITSNDGLSLPHIAINNFANELIDPDISYRILRLLILEGVNLNQHDGNGETPTHYAVRANLLAALRSMLGINPDTTEREEDFSNFANINLPDNQGRTPLHLMVAQGRFDMIIFLTANPYITEHYRVNVNAHDHNGQTPAHAAVQMAVDRAQAPGYYNDADRERGRINAHE